MSTGWASIDNALAALGIRFGAPTPGQTTAGTHVPTSEHYQGRARDYGDANSDSAAIVAALEPLAEGPGAPIDELFWSPGNVFLKNGAVISPDPSLRQEHYDHVHVGIKADTDLTQYLASAGVASGPGDGSAAATPVGFGSSLTKDAMRFAVEATLVLGGLALVVLGVIRTTHRSQP